MSSNETKHSKEWVLNGLGVHALKDQDVLEKFYHRPPHMKKAAQKNNDQTFEKIIMECTDMFSMEKEVEKIYKKWNNKSRMPHIWFRSGHKPKIIKSLLGFVISAVSIPYLSSAPATSAILNLYVIAVVMLTVWFIRCSFRVIGGLMLDDWGIKFRKLNPKKLTKQDELGILKYQFHLTISKLDGRLDLIKGEIEDQIRRHKDDIEKLAEYSHILTNTEEVRGKINTAIQDLNKSYGKVSAKKVEIKKFLSEYIGDNGYISQKEKEINDLKIAQDLSDRIKSNLGITMEITKNIDILTDAIIPGIKKLMEFRIPELVRDVEFECDKNRVLLEIKE
jgi:hypothetical protein